jgi:hypothetical protein
MEGMSWLFQEPPRDPELGAALRRMEDELQRDDMENLRRRIVTAAGPMLTALRSPTPRWWELISRWMPVAVPVGLAAALAAGLLLPGAADLTTLTTSEGAADSTLVTAAFADGSAGGELAAWIIAPGTSDWLWQQAVAQ